MPFISFGEAYLPNSNNMTQSIKCTINVDHISMVVPLNGDVAGARSALTVAGHEVHVRETQEEVEQMLLNPTKNS